MKKTHGVAFISNNVATKAAYHTTLQTTPAQLVFGRDAILKVKFVVLYDMLLW